MIRFILSETRSARTCTTNETNQTKKSVSNQIIGCNIIFRLSFNVFSFRFVFFLYFLMIMSCFTIHHKISILCWLLACWMWFLCFSRYCCCCCSIHKTLLFCSCLVFLLLLNTIKTTVRASKMVKNKKMKKSWRKAERNWLNVLGKF